MNVDQVTPYNLQDISGRDEATLGNTENIYRQLADLSLDMMTVICEGRFVYINPVGANVLGVTDPKELVGKLLRSVLKTLCKRAVGQTAARQPVLENDGELIHRSAPILYRHCPSFADIFQGKIQNLEYGFVRWEHRSIFNDFPRASYSKIQSYLSYKSPV